MNLNGNEEIVAEGRWISQDSQALVNGTAIGPNAVKVFVDLALLPDTFLWRPTTELSTIADSFKSFIAWPANRVVIVTNAEDAAQPSKPETTQGETTSYAATPASPVNKVKKVSQSPVRRSPVKS